jgi:dihydroorotase
LPYDMIIKNGRVVDPSRGIDRTEDVFVSGNRMAGPDGTVEAAPSVLVLEAAGCIVVPGLLDFHTHLFKGGSELGIPPDLSLLPNGITFAVDAGSTGCDNYESFHDSVIARSLVGIRTLLNVSPLGQATSRFAECIDPRYYDEKKMNSLFEKYNREIIGLKIRLSKKIVGSLGLAPLHETIRLAEHLGCRIEVHPTDPAFDTDQIVNLLRGGDIFVHMLHGSGSTILDDSSHVRASVRRARERGVVFDAGEGRFNFSFKTAAAAIADSFLPDVVSSDVNAFAIYRHPVVSLPNIISKYLALGMDLNTVIGGCTCVPARILNLQDDIGTLKPGACADIGIFKLVDERVDFLDSLGQRIKGEKLFTPMATIKSGILVYRRIDFR